MRFFLMLCAVFFLATPNSAGAAAAPDIGIASFSDLSVPDAPFDPKADANAAVESAFARAKNSGKPVLIHLGANWCADCRILLGIMELPEMRVFLNAHYEMVDVDVGRYDRNMQIPARFGVSDSLYGLPAILIVAPDGGLLNAGHVEALVDTRRKTPQALADWLAGWTN